MKKQVLETGRIVGTHGVRSEMRVEPWCDSPAFLADLPRLYWKGGEPLRFSSMRVHKNIVILKAEGVDSIEQAEACRGRILYLDRADVPLGENDYFVQDLLGCRVLDADSGRYYGSVCEVSATGANDVWHMKDEEGTVRLVPAIPDVLVSVDTEGETILIRPLPGLFEEGQGTR